MENSSRDGNNRPPYLSPENQYVKQEARVGTRHGTMDWFKLEKEYIKAVYCYPAYFQKLRIPWIARRSNYPILKEISPDYSLEGLMLKLKLQYFGWLIGKVL